MLFACLLAPLLAGLVFFSGRLFLTLHLRLTLAFFSPFLFSFSLFHLPPPPPPHPHPPHPSVSTTQQSISGDALAADAVDEEGNRLRLPSSSIGGTGSSRRNRTTAVGDAKIGGSFWSQFSALSNKTMIYQKRQRCQSACLCCFPIFCIAMLLVVQALLNNLNPTKLYDFDCINNKFGDAFLHSPYGQYATCPSAQCLTVGDKSLLNPNGGENSEIAT